MQTRNPLLSDLARMATGAMGAAHGLRREIETLVESRLNRLLARLDLVTREEFEAVKAMAANARDEQERLAQRLEALETARRAPSRRKR